MGNQFTFQTVNIQIVCVHNKCVMIQTWQGYLYSIGSKL